MNVYDSSLSASDAARQLGVSIKALRLYEQRGLLTAERTAAGYRRYESHHMTRAAQIVALRALGLSLAQIGPVLDGNPQTLHVALAAHEASLAAEIRKLVSALDKVRALQSDPVAATTAPVVAFDLPWPWAGERFELADIRAINFIVGPLGSGKTRFARRLAQSLPNAVFLGLERLQESDALTALLECLESNPSSIVVVDMVEQGLDEAAQKVLIARLRERARNGASPLFLMTRSSAVLNLATIGPDEAILFCPANHSPPFRVTPRQGAPGYEAVATCLASPEVRARTAGVIAWRDPSALSA